jgi:hypothetical protein
MARSMSPRTPHWEKSGNVTWVACRSCRDWFPVDPALIAMGTIDLVCPHCGDRFKPPEASRTIDP